MSAAPREKRDFLRVPFLTDVLVRCGDTVIRGQAQLTVSMKGLGFTTSDPLPAIGAACSVSMAIGGVDHPVVIEADGTVVRSERGNVAIEFSGLDIDGYRHLRRLIVSNAADPERAEQECEAHLGIRKRPQTDG